MLTMELRTEELDKQETPPNLINLLRRPTKSVPGSSTLWFAYILLLEMHGGEYIKDLEIGLVSEPNEIVNLC